MSKLSLHFTMLLGCAALALSVAAAAGCSRSPHREADPRIADKSRPLVMLTHPTEPPHSYINEAGEFAGTDIELARKVAQRMNRQLIVEGVDFTEIIPRLKVGTADFAIATITITDARRSDVDFSIPYDEDGACFIYRTDGVKPRMSEISSLRIGVETDTVHDIYLCWHGCDPMRFDRLSDAVKALERDELDAVFFDAPPLRSIAAQSGGRLAVTPLMSRERYGIAVDKRRPDVLAAANAVISEGGAK